jgi:hypothetical protein
MRNANMRIPHMEIIKQQYLRQSTKATVGGESERRVVRCRRAAMYSSPERCVACDYLWFAAFLVIVLLLTVARSPGMAH